MALTTRLTKVGHGSEHFNERTGMCYHQTPPWERVVGHVRDAGQAKPHLEHNPLSLLGACYATSRRQLNDPGNHTRVIQFSKAIPMRVSAKSGWAAKRRHAAAMFE